MNSSFDGPNRRRHKRIYKNFILSYRIKENPSLKFEVSQLSNISRGGMCFSSSHPFASGTELLVDLKTPYLGDVIHLEGCVLESREKIKNLIYEIRLEFTKINEQSLYVLRKIEDFSKHRE